MFKKKKCSGCAKKIERGFNYCPYCGMSIKEKHEREDFGLLGRRDSEEMFMQETKLPFGMEKLMSSLMKQLEKQMNNLNREEAKFPKGFSIRVSTGKPQNVRQVVERVPQKDNRESPSPEEQKRRLGLPKEEATSKVKRLSDRIIYELHTPGIQSKRDIVLTRLASGFEIRAYAKNKCYVKTIPLKVEIIGCYVKEEKVFVELKAE